VKTARLRDQLRGHILALKDAGTHDMLPGLCADLALPAPPSEGSKRERFAASFDALAEDYLPTVAERLLSRRSLRASERNELQELLWDGCGPSVPKRFRREVSRAIETLELFLDRRRFDELLDRLWVLQDDALLGWVDEFSLKDAIEQYVHRNPGDWPAETLFDKLGAFDCSDRRFGLFLEGLASADVRPDESAQRSFVAAVNKPLAACRVELRETGNDGGYPVFTLVSTAAGPRGRPKNLIFASSVKPDLRFRDAVDNDIEIVTNADRVLVYDRAIGVDGLRWRDLQAWWAETKGFTDAGEAKKDLYGRLRESLPQSSPPQGRLFGRVPVRVEI
jgi:hypothetical protein